MCIRDSPCLCLFLVSYAKKIEARPEKGALADRAPGMQAPEAGQTFVRNRGMDKGLALFAGILGAGIVLIFSSSFIPALQGVLLPLVAVIFLVAGLAASIACGLRGKKTVSYTHLDVYKRQVMVGEQAAFDFEDTKKSYRCLLYTSRCV